MEEVYRRQAELLIRCLPEIEKQTCFALKGGTAINLFVRDMPRLSVDIDLVYLPIEPRDQTLTKIQESLNEIADDIRRHVTGSNITTASSDDHINKLFVQKEGVQIRIEPNIVQRGAIYEIENRELCKRAETEYEISATANTLAVPELYGSKITAALDRQHPRDLFDIKLLFEAEGITDEIRRAFVVYLASHPRPMSELLYPNEKDIKNEFHTQFQGMTNTPVELNELLKVRDILVKSINENLLDNERQFLLSLKMGNPNWSLIDIPNIDQLPGIRWKVQNIQRMDKKKHEQAIDKLKSVLNL